MQVYAIIKIVRWFVIFYSKYCEYKGNYKGDYFYDGEDKKV